jgi:hypothetical protein
MLEEIRREILDALAEIRKIQSKLIILRIEELQNENR